MFKVKGTTGRLKVGAASGLVEAADEAAAKIFEATTEWISGKKFDSLFPQVTWPVMVRYFMQIRPNYSKKCTI